MGKYYWGEADSLINWCELDYIENDSIIAEFWNSWSNSFFIISGLVAIRLTYKHNLPLPYTITSFSIIFTGLFSFCFHASLRYWMQKLDESFETLLLLGIFHSFDSTNQFMFTHMCSAVIGILFIEKWFCEIHLILVAILTFFQLYQLGWKILNQSNQTKLYYKLFPWIRNYFLIAGVTWLIDRIACDYLYNLPYDLPNPQLHASGWHLFCALGVNQTMFAVCIMNKLYKYKPIEKNKDNNVVFMRTFCGIPYDIYFNVHKIQKGK